MAEDGAIHDLRAAAESERIITTWIEETIGGRVLRLDRQGRWRPAWFAEVKTAGGVKELYVRGARQRTGSFPFPLEREYEIHRLLEDGGVKVAHLYGYIPEAPAYVMDKVAGRHDLRHAASEADRESVRRQLVREMAKMHKLDPAPFRAVGLHAPKTPIETTLAFFDHVAASSEASNAPPNPRLTFLVQWVRRNAPPAKTEPRVTACDAGQFMYDGPELTAMMDFELAMLGDPLQDLAILRRRTTYEPMGDIPSLFRMYEEEMGEEIDLDMLYFHTALSSTAAVMAAVPLITSYLDAPTEDGDFVQYLNWVTNSTKQGFEGVAEAKRYRMPELKIPDPAHTFAHDALVAARATVSGLDHASDYDAYRRRAMLDNIAYQERIAAYGGQFTHAYLNEAAQILGSRPRDTLEADRLLAAYVDQAGPAEDERLFKVLAADSLRRSFLLAIPGSTYLQGLTQPVQPLV